MSKVNHNPTQNKRILDYMEKRGSITQLEALQHCGVMRLASRISDLRMRGHAIESEMVTVKNQFGEDCRVKRYRLGANNG
jgi:hypothetical protein